MVLYKQLREKSLQTLRGAVMIPPRAEWEFVIHTANLYERMGCDLLALDLGTLSFMLIIKRGLPSMVTTHNIHTLHFNILPTLSSQSRP